MPHFPFQRLQADLAALIAKMPAGSRLPSEPDLAADMGVSRATLREAMRTFETQGLIRRRQGAGTFVVGKPPVIESGLEVLESMLTLARRCGLDVGPGPVTIEQVLADKETAECLGVPEGTRLVRVSRTMRADSRPVAYLVDTLPEEVLHPEELTTKFSGSVLDYLLQRGDPLATSRAEISALGATAEVAKMLEIQRDDVLLKLTAKLYTVSGHVVDYSHSYFLPGYFNFHVVRKVGGA
jgi:GntR family transcriptional regulator